MGHAPENTLRSVRTALELGADGVEVDVYFVDGELLVFHDARLERTTNGTGLIHKTPLARLRALDAGDGERIPTLREVFDTMGDTAFLNVELKGPGTAAPVTALIREYVRDRQWPLWRFLVSSFDKKELRDARALDPDVRIGFLAGARWSARMLDAARELRAYSLNLAVRLANEKTIASARREGLKVFVYTVNEPALAIELESLGCAGVFSDFPDRILNRHRAITRA